MATRVINTLTREGSTHSESEKSFVSAEYVIDDTGGQSASPQHRIEKPDATTNLIQNTNIKSDKSEVAKHQNKLESSSNQPRAPPSLSGESYFSQHPRAGGNEPRSPQIRRPPASRSSHGIATKAGPPPALSTQRTYTQSPGRTTPPVDARGLYSRLALKRNPVKNNDLAVTESEKPARASFGPVSSRPGRVTSARPSTSDGVMTGGQDRRFGYTESEKDNDSTLRLVDDGLQRGGLKKDGDTYQRSKRSSEDLFFSLARDDSIHGGPAASGRRGSHFGSQGLTQIRATRPSSSGRPYTSGDASMRDPSSESSFDSTLHPSSRKDTFTATSSVFLPTRAYAASAHPLGETKRNRSARTSMGPFPSVEDEPPETPMPYGRRRSIREASPGGDAKSYRHSSLAQRANDDYESQPFQGASTSGQAAAQDVSRNAGTESTVSTTAPSTVWDELDDLKSRLRKLELTGTLPKSSNAAISNVLHERPNTATTTMTTMSSSPKRRHKESLSPEASTNKNQIFSNLHPLLHSALAKAKPSMKPNLYKALETTAADALTLAAMTGSSGSQGNSPHAASIISQSQGIDKQLRRKADSMCRSLTELCIAMAEDVTEDDTVRSKSISADSNSTEIRLPKTRLLYDQSDGPETRSSSRVMTRLEARRASLLASSPLNGRRGSAQELTTTSQNVTPLTNRLENPSSQYSRDRPNGNRTETSNRPRPPSRAATEIGQNRPSPQTRISREYTSQHPMPTASHQSPVVQSALPTRKSFFTSATSSPLSPNVQPGNRRYLDHSTPPSSAESARLAEARQRRIASLGQHQSRIGISSGRLKQPNNGDL